MDAFFFFFRACSLYVRRMVPSFIVELHKATKEDPLLVFERSGKKKEVLRVVTTVYSLLFFF